MRRFTRTGILAGGAAIAFAGLGAVRAAHGDSNQVRHAGEAMQAQERIDRSFTLRPGAEVSVSGIAGPVTVETTDGDRAEVHVLRMARTQHELDCYRTLVEERDGGLRIAHERVRSRECRSIRSRQEVRLRLPRSANLSLSSVAGRVEIGALAGRVRLDSVAGHVRIAGARAGSVSSLAGGLDMTIGALDPHGIRISSVVGGIELGFLSEAHAEVSVDSVTGSVQSETPRVRIYGENHAFRARVGDGGPPLVISSVVGPVRLRSQ